MREIIRAVDGNTSASIVLYCNGPFPRVPAARLLGARLCNVGGDKIPLASYERQGRRMSIFAMGRASANVEGECQEGVRGFTVCRRAAAGTEYMLVSDYPQAEAKRLLIAALSPQDSR